VPNPDKVAVCPFYERESTRSITCEGMTDTTQCSIKFPDEGGKRRWFDKYCGGFEYTKCPYARYLENVKYGG